MNNETVEKTVKVRVYSAALASNMASLSNGRSIGGLRSDMGAAGYKIGQGTLERIYKGDKGVRMESLEKVADYFGTEVDQLMRDTANAAITAPSPTVSATGGPGTLPQQQPSGSTTRRSVHQLGAKLKNASPGRQAAVIALLADYGKDPDRIAKEIDMLLEQDDNPST